MELAQKKTRGTKLMGWIFMPENHAEVAKFITGPSKEDCIWAHNWLDFERGSREYSLEVQFKEVLERLTENQKSELFYELTDLPVAAIDSYLWISNNMDKVISTILEALTEE